MSNRRLYNRLSGINPLSYIGVEPLSPMNLVVNNRTPTVNDKNYNEGAIWLVEVSPFPVYMLASLNNNSATWIQLAPASSGGANDFVTDSGTATQVGGILNMFGANVITTSGASNTVTIALENGTDGQVIIGGGADPLYANITSLGGTVSITNGANSINLETSSGQASNFQGNTGPEVPPDGAGTINVLGDNAVGLTTDGDAGTNTLTITTVNNEQVLLSLTGNSSGPVYGDVNNNIDVLGADVLSIAGNPGTNTLTISASSTAASSFPTDSGTAIPAAGALTIAGGTLINTSGAGSTVTINLDNGLDGQTIIGATAGSPAYANLTSSGGTVTITNGPNSINLEVGSEDISALAYVGASVANVTGDGTIASVVCDVEVYDTNNAYDPVTGIFTAPFTGHYFISWNVNLNNYTSGGISVKFTQSSIVTSNRTYQILNRLTIPRNLTTVGITPNSEYTPMFVIADMDAADTCSVQVMVNSVTGVGPKTVGVTGHATDLITYINFKFM